jgi:phospholipid-binding lipoprotein MlaA
MPWTAVNDFFQGRPERSYVALVRFLINSTVGVLGIFDVATGWGFPAHEEDLGQTLGVLGLPDTPYLVLPIFGPSNPRDALGMIGDYYLDPVNIIARNNDGNDTWIPSIRSGVTALDSRARNDQIINDLKRQSTDFYATVRSVYRQRRDAQIKNRGEDPSNYPGPKLVVEPAGAHPYRPPATTLSRN